MVQSLNNNLELLTIGPKALKPNPALQPFEPLIGDWRTNGEHPYLPNIALQGKASFTWIANGAFLQMQTEIDHPEIPDGIAIIGSDDSAGSFYMLYFDERGVSRKYDVAVTSSGFTWWRDDVQLSQRVTIAVEDGQLISRGEMARDGGAWEPDLCLTYKRVIY